MQFNNLIFEIFDNPSEEFEPTENLEIDEARIVNEALVFDLQVQQKGISEFYYVKIPMTQGNRSVLKKVLSETGNTVKKETDDRGRFNLGTEYGDQEVEVIVLD